MKTKQFPSVLAAFAVLILFTISCNTASKESPETVDSATLKQEIEAANVEWTYSNPSGTREMFFLDWMHFNRNLKTRHFVEHACPT